MDLGLKDKVAIVTGSSRGIGKSIAERLADEGAKVMICARGEERLEQTRKELAHSFGDDRIAASRVDISDPAGREKLVDATKNRFGRLDILVNSAGGSGGTTSLETPLDEWQRVMNMNVWSGLELVRLAAPIMREHGGGAILFITSIWGRESGGRPPYNIAKAAETSLAKALANDLASWGIRVNSLAPGSIIFPGGTWERRQQADPEGIRAWLERDFPFVRFGRPDEVADAAAFLVSERASWVHGACLVVDGGQSASY